MIDYTIEYRTHSDEGTSVTVKSHKLDYPIRRGDHLEYQDRVYNVDSVIVNTDFNTIRVKAVQIYRLLNKF